MYPASPPCKFTTFPRHPAKKHLAACAAAFIFSILLLMSRPGFYESGILSFNRYKYDQACRHVPHEGKSGRRYAPRGDDPLQGKHRKPAVRHPVYPPGIRRIQCQPQREMGHLPGERVRQPRRCLHLQPAPQSPGSRSGTDAARRRAQLRGFRMSLCRPMPT